MFTSMCGRLNVLDDTSVFELCEQLGLDLRAHQNVHQGRFIRATQTVEILINDEKGLRRVPATWWLLLDKCVGEDNVVGFKPSRYTSFNTRYDKLNVPRSAGYQSYRKQRCVVLVKGFGESQKVADGTMQYTDFLAEPDKCIALGGLYRVWQPGSVYSFSIITTPAHPKIASYHQKASPLMLNQDDDTLHQWLDYRETNTQLFDPLLTPRLPQNIIAQPIDKPSLYNAIAPSVLIPRD
ncbi:SOS response-associated peptidase family protein [Alteromonas sp. ASW11-36]|uniref:Abasic site processing protein n=1 Tax=Alteromonas arenosi TaxID=3055817 RepID=A0ABT7SXQ9_9ALTE|nr:SOS response-associated peptidase family protein [Alteromonas sp. ASW11-36]MDM7860981.1 SOS response-associated peptidase family protein [Alteromonas sp. ASW11-36]